MGFSRPQLVAIGVFKRRGPLFSELVVDMANAVVEGLGFTGDDLEVLPLACILSP